MSARDHFLVALPPRAALADLRLPWWRIEGEAIVARGVAPAEPLPLAPQASEPARIVALAPAAEVMLHRAAFAGLTDRQAEAAGRLLAGEQSLSPLDSLHVVTGHEAEAGMRDIAVVSTTMMSAWLRWCGDQGIDPDAITPAALMITPDSGSGADPKLLLRGTVGDEVILRGADVTLVEDELLVAPLRAAGHSIADADSTTVAAAMARAVGAPPLDLRTGAFARRSGPRIDRVVLRRAAMLVGAIVIVSLLIALAQLAHLWADTARLDARAQADAASVLSPAPALDAAAQQLDARLATLGGGPARVTAPLAAVVSAIEPVPTISLDTLAWHGDGTLSVTLGGPRAEDINTVLLALQARGYTVTAQPRSGSDGRVLADITVRSVK